MPQNFERLTGAIYTKFGSKSKFSKAMGYDRNTIDSKLSGRSEWTVADIKKARELLNIPEKQIVDYFFAK